MKGRFKILFSLFVALAFVFGLLALPEIDTLAKTCTGTFICGVDIKALLSFLGKSSTTAVAFGYYLYQKIITGAIVFVITLTLSIAAHRAYRKYKKEEV